MISSILNLRFLGFRLSQSTRYFIFLLAVFSIACTSSTKLGKPTHSEKSLECLKRQIESALSDSALYQSRTGIKVVSLGTGQVLFQKSNQLLFHPASNMKLLTTATALKKLGPNYRLKTFFLTDTSSVKDSTISGNLYIKGFGNPALMTKDLWGIAQKFKELDIRKITGDLICDETYLDDYYRGAGWMWDDASSRSYPPIGALTVNRNCVTVKVKPGAEVGDTVAVYLDPPTSYVTIENFGATADSSDTTLLKDFKIERKWREGQNTIAIKGGLETGSPQKVRVVEIVEPALYFGKLFAELLADEKIALNGNIVKGTSPDTNMVVVEHWSQPLSWLITQNNKDSDNLYAELLLKTLGAEIMGPPGSAAKGLSTIKQYFHQIGVDTTSFGLADGSGVSRYNMISPDQIIELLKTMYKDFRVRAEFVGSLPIAGVDGTLRNRMKSTPAEGKLRAKTGTLRGTSALSGYTTTADGEPIAFSIIMEHFVKPTSAIRKIQDRIGIILSSWSPKMLARF